MKKVLILGKGKSAKSAEIWLNINNYKTICVDDNDEVYQNRELKTFNLAVVSPGFNPQNNWIVAINNVDLPIVSEIDLGVCELDPSKIIAVTGTNGKTTIVSLLNFLIDGSIALGNIGNPICANLSNIKKESVIILELSSFMLYYSEKIQPKIAILSNITPDHINWHGSYDNYLLTKLKIFKNQNKNDFAILDADDANFDLYSSFVKSKIISISLKKKVNGCYLKNGNIIFSFDHINEIVVNESKLKIKGEHNLKNIMMCICAAFLMGSSLEQISKRLVDFCGLEHRIEFVSEINGVSYINDSKSTNLDSTIVACKAFKNPINLLVGGFEKKLDVFPMFLELKDRVKNIIAFGNCGRRYYEAAKSANVRNVFLEKGLKEAVDRAYKISKKGDVVLLSPATSSFDEFKSYEERGCIFKQLVKEIGKK